MNVSDFKLIDVIGTSCLDWKFKAVVTVTTKRFMRKPLTEKREVFKTYAGRWYYIETGEYAGSEVASLCRALEARKGKDLEYCLNN